MGEAGARQGDRATQRVEGARVVAVAREGGAAVRPMSVRRDDSGSLLGDQAGLEPPSLVSRRSLFTSPVISISPQPRHIDALVITSPVCRVRNFESCGRKVVRTAE